MTRLTIFDVDGTLVDSQDLIYAAIAATFARFKLPAPERRHALGGVGLSLEPAFLRLVGEGGPWREMAVAYGSVFTELRQDPLLAAEPFFPGAKEIVETLAARPDHLLGIATGKSKRGMARLFARTGWKTLFATVQTADDHPSKPHPSMVLAALAETGVSPHSALLVGDTTYDIEMACAAGVAAVGVAWGHHGRDELIAAGASRVIDSFAELDAMLEIAR